MKSFRSKLKTLANGRTDILAYRFQPQGLMCHIQRDVTWRYLKAYCDARAYCFLCSPCICLKSFFELYAFSPRHRILQSQRICLKMLTQFPSCLNFPCPTPVSTSSPDCINSPQYFCPITMNIYLNISNIFWH
jgi:hypothetical protein